MTPEEYQKLLIETAEQLLTAVPQNAASRLDELMTEAVMSGWNEEATTKFSVSMVIAYATYIDKKFENIWTKGTNQ